jgi:hypothetical protein
MTFQLFCGDESQWDDCFSAADFQTPFQTANWGRIKALEGWTSLRVWDPQNRSGIQFLRKTIMRGVSILWAPSVRIPAVNDYPSLTSCLENTCSRLFYARIGFAASQDSDASASISESYQTWSQLTTHLGAPTNYLLRILPKEDDQFALCSSNWKRNLTRGLKRTILIEFGDSIDSRNLARIIKEMYAYKSFQKNDWRCSPTTLGSYFSAFGHSQITVSVRARNGDLLALRSAVVIGTNAFDMIAATTLSGRKSYASYAAIWQLINELRKQGVCTYDLGGTDLIANPGVHNFKSGLGGQLIINPPDLEVSNPRFLRRVAHTVIKTRSVSE